jgi:hypothetical protein
MSSIWEIIPEITSPLAVVCFGFYVFYLFKQSEDKKKEKSLKIKDATAQKIVVDKILNDYPDIKIDRIKDPVGALELAKKIIDDKLRKYHKTMNTLLIFVGIFALTFLISQVITSFKIFESDKSNVIGNETSWAEEQSIKEHKDYALLSVTLHINLEDVKDNNKLERKAFFRTYYTLKSLKDITKQDKVFEEVYKSSVIPVQQWPGSEKQEIESIDDGTYWIKFDCKKDEIKTITTGANYFYPIPLPVNSTTSCFGNIISSNNEWMTCYPNSSDYIDNLTIVVEGENVDVSLPATTYRKDKEDRVSTDDGFCNVYSTDNHCTLVAKWQKISPSECVGFKINWSLPHS